MSALYYYRARTYDPKVGRFLQSDPLSPRPLEMNPYVYAANNPLRFVDPYGLLVAFGCRGNDVMNISLSAAGAEEAAGTCLPPDLGTQFKAKLEAATVWCDYSNRNDCGQACEGGDSIDLYDSALCNDPGCRSLASTIFHEVLRLVGGLSREIRALETKCIRRTT